MPSLFIIKGRWQGHYSMFVHKIASNTILVQKLHAAHLALKQLGKYCLSFNEASKLNVLIMVLKVSDEIILSSTYKTMKTAAVGPFL